MDSAYQALDNDDQELFQRHSKGIDKAVREAFPDIPANFQLQPTTIRKIHGCGMFYDLKFALPNGQFVKVSFHTGGFPLTRMPGDIEPEQHFNVDPTPASSAYD